MRFVALCLTLLFFSLPHLAIAAEVAVMCSGGLTSVYRQLAPIFETRTGHKVTSAFGPSMGTAPTAIPVRLGRGEPADVVIMARESLDGLAAKGQVVQGSQVDIVLSRIAMAVKTGAPQPDISTEESLKRTLLAAKSVGYSDSASGVYLSTVLFKRLGIEAEMAAKGRKIQATPVGEIVAKGEVEIGFQQLSELKHVSGITVVGLIPESLQKVTAFSAGVTTRSRSPAEARELIRFMTLPEFHGMMREAGLDPASSR